MYCQNCYLNFEQKMNHPQKRVKMTNDSYITKLDIRNVKLKRGLLSKLDVELTERCNNNCIHCYINLPPDDPVAKGRELSTEETKDIIKQAADLGCLSMLFTGGESLLREDFEEIYVYTRKNGIKVFIFTNATLIDTKMIDLFKRIPLLGKIEITVYGMKKKSYEAVSRVPGSYEAAWRGINLLLENKIPFLVKSVVLPPTKDEIPEFNAWAATIPGMDDPANSTMYLDLRANHDSEIKNRQIKGLRLSSEEFLDFNLHLADDYLADLVDFCSRCGGAQGDSLFPCDAAKHNKGCVDAYGRLKPCIGLSNPETAYDLKKGTLKDAITNFFPKVREMKAKNPEYLARCARCYLRGICEQCPGKAWAEYGTMDTPIQYLCDIVHLQARRAGLLNEGEMSWEVEDWEERLKKFKAESPNTSL